MTTVIIIDQDGVKTVLKGVNVKIDRDLTIPDMVEVDPNSFRGSTRLNKVRLTIEMEFPTDSPILQKGL